MIKVSNDSLMYEVSRIKDSLKLAVIDLRKNNKRQASVVINSSIVNLEMLERLLDMAIEEEPDFKFLECELEQEEE